MLCAALLCCALLCSQQVRCAERELPCAGKARKLIAAKDLEGLLALLEDDPGLVMTRDLHGRTVLHSLAAAGDAQLLQQVLERVPSMASQVDSVDENLDAPLHLAVRAGGEGCVRPLLGAGANPNLQNRCAALPCAWGCKWGGSSLLASWFPVDDCFASRGTGAPGWIGSTIVNLQDKWAGACQLAQRPT
jgi:ankyrin repeat protein